MKKQILKVHLFEPFRDASQKGGLCRQRNTQKIPVSNIERVNQECTEVSVLAFPDNAVLRDMRLVIPVFPTRNDEIFMAYDSDVREAGL